MGRIADLTHTLRTGLTVYPGTQPPVIEEACSVEKDGFSERQIIMFSHTGTHLDVPAHIFPNGDSLSGISADHFYGTALKLTISHGKEISIHFIEERIQLLGKPDFIIFATGWDKFWNSEKYFSDFPLPPSEIFEYLGNSIIKGIGIDAISIDLIENTKLQNHQLILSKGKIIVENLTELWQLPDDSLFDFYCFPLKIQDGDGSPVRAVAKIN